METLMCAIHLHVRVWGVNSAGLYLNTDDFLPRPEEVNTSTNLLPLWAALHALFGAVESNVGPFAPHPLRFWLLSGVENAPIKSDLHEATASRPALTQVISRHFHVNPGESNLSCVMSVCLVMCAWSWCSYEMEMFICIMQHSLHPTCRPPQDDTLLYASFCIFIPFL
ncbi:hypothetical protein L3Q82_001422 [Scortum barcoo]|uniref:Uncharacterized protein n=1 Tax=Scortum barcoo TaxID=214431 RepID=A0ACB8W822_9TELE|nr:hypothetical protein L3Q82_001422 [Scortum barcoo]